MTSAPSCLAACRVSRACRTNERLHLIEDRAEIAEDLRHRVIQRLFGLGLALQGAASRSAQPHVHGLIETQIDEVDAIIRTCVAVFTLDRRGEAGPAGNGGGATRTPSG